jgi:DNA-directed RNA polymerase subunit alpha
MLDFIKPRLEIDNDSDDGSYGKFIIGPFDRGFGTTLGNSVRRVLLSSIPGTAVSNVKIKGIVHEFTGIYGVKEDVTDIILNLKQLAIKDNSNRHSSRVAYINKSGIGEVTGADLKSDSDIEVLNKDLHIAFLGSEDSDLSLELVLTYGRGYVSAEKNKAIDSSIGTIAIDSIYTPIKCVNFSVEDMRVGNMTDYDKLILEIWTNGTISARNALSYASRIIIDHLSNFVYLADNISDVEEQQENITSDSDITVNSRETRSEADREKLLQQPIEELEFSVRAYNCLKRAGINTIDDLVNKSEEDMLKVRNLGRKSFDEVVARLADLGMKLKPTEE